MATYRDPLLDYLGGTTNAPAVPGQASDQAMLPPGTAPPTDTPPAKSPEIAALESALAAAQAAYKEANARHTAALTAKSANSQTGGPEYDRANAAAEAAKADMAEAAASIRAYTQKIAAVHGALAEQAAKPPKTGAAAMTYEQLLAKQAELQAEIANRQLQTSAFTQSEETRRSREAQAAAAANLRYTQGQENYRLGLTQGLTREQMAQTAAQNAEANRQAMIRALMDQVGLNERANADNALKSYYDQLQAQVAKGTIDAANAGRQLDKFRLAMEYANTENKQIGTDRYVASLAGRPLPAQPRINPFDVAGFRGVGGAPPSRLPNTDVGFTPPALPTLPTLNTLSQVNQLQQMAQQLSPFNQAQLPHTGVPIGAQVTAPPPPPPTLPGYGPAGMTDVVDQTVNTAVAPRDVLVARAQPALSAADTRSLGANPELMRANAAYAAPGGPYQSAWAGQMPTAFNTAALTQQLAAWRQQRIAANQDPNDIQAFMQQTAA